MFKIKRILITGANSYIGVNSESWLKRYPDKYQIDSLDMKNPDWINYDFSKYDVVFHVAGMAHVDIAKSSAQIEKTYREVNTDLAVAVATKAKKAGVRQFIFMSSMSIYGDLSCITENSAQNPINIYGESKKQADEKIRDLQSQNFNVAVIRPPMIYGKGCKGKYPKLSKIARKCPVFPKVKNKRSMLYIYNFCEFLKLLIDNEDSGVFFPQNKEYVNTGDLVKLIAYEHNHKVWITSLLTPFVYIGKKLPGKIGNLCNKAFGNSFYTQNLSKYKSQYAIFSLEESIKQTENDML